jgi:hypothetical protein
MPHRLGMNEASIRKDESFTEKGKGIDLETMSHQSGKDKPLI